MFQFDFDCPKTQSTVPEKSNILMGEMPERKTVIIIGSGVGGTAIAARLAKRGFHVKVFEKNSFSGGRLSLIHQNGHRFDQGPSLYLMPKLFDETFNDLDESVRDHIDLIKCETNYTVYFHDGDTFDLSSDLVKMYEQIKRLEGDDEHTLLNFLDFLKESHSHYERSIEIALRQNYEHWYNEFQLKHIPSVLKLHLWDNVYTRATKYFRSEKMLKAFTFQTLYIGMSPHDCPAMFNLLQYTEIAEGVWYPRGGFHKVVECLERIAKMKYGAQFEYGAGIERIIVDENNVAKGVRLDDGREEYADIVVCNADLVYAYNKLLPETTYGKNLDSKGEHTSSSFSFYWGMTRKMPELDVHNIFIAKNYKQSFDDIFKKHSLPDDPTIYIHVPSRIDPDAAPKGKETMVVLLPTGHLTPTNQNSIEELTKRARQTVIDKLERLLKIKNLEDLIETEVINDPCTWQTKFNLWHGSILGLSHGIPQLLHYRPATRSHLFKNLYFVGASVHPGTGVPIVLSCAKLVENQILGDSGIVERKTDDVKIFLEFLLLSAFIFVLVAVILIYFY